MWSVEWIHPDGRKTIGRCHEARPLGESFARHMEHLSGIQSGKRSREDDEDESRAKSKRIRGRMKELGLNPRLKGDPEDSRYEGLVLEKQQPAISHLALKPESQTSRTPDLNASVALSNKPLEINPESLNQHSSTTEATVTPTLRPPDLNNPSMDQMPSANNTSVISTLPTPPAAAKQTTPPKSVSFYLHHPSLPSKHPVLIPLFADSILATSLTNRLVLEFPTIYVIYQQPDGKLPDGFISEEDFFASAKKVLIKELVEGDQGSYGMDMSERRDGDLEEGQVDERRVAEVLGKDLRGLVAAV